MSIQKGDEEAFDTNMRGFFVLLAITVALAFGKLVGAWAGMSWWLVTSPLWLPYALMATVVVLFLLLLVVALIAGGFFGLLSGITLVLKRRKGDGK